MSMGDDLRAAVRDAELGLDLIDMIGIMRRDLRQFVWDRDGSDEAVAVYIDEWQRFRRSKRDDPSPDALDKAWERWKTNVRRHGLERKGLGSLMVERVGRENWPIMVGIPEALDWAEAAISRAKRLSEAASAVAGRGRGVLKRVRDVSVKDAFRALDILYTSTRVATWLERGAPFTSARRGQRTFYYTSPEELEDWIRSAVEVGEINDPFRDRIPIEEARPRILAAIERSGLSKLEFANRIDVNYGALQSYVTPASKVRKVPVDVVERSEELAEKSPGTDLHSKFARHGTPPLSTIRAALKASGGKLSEASRALTGRGFTGVTPENVRYIAKKHGIPYLTRAITAPTRSELHDALVRLDYNITHTAREFGISESSVSRLIDNYGLRELVAPHLRAPTKQDLVDAMDSVGHDAAAAGELLGISESRFRALLSKHGLSERFEDLAVRERDAGFYAEYDRMSAEIEKAIKDGETRNDLAQRLGMKRTSVEAAVRRLRLRERYNELRYEVGAKARGSTREIGGDRVPFWHAALIEAMRRHPDGGMAGIARRMGMAPGVSARQWLSGQRVPRYDVIEKIMELAGRTMPDWIGVLRRAVAESGNLREAAEKIGIERGALYSLVNGHVNPSEKMLEKILGDDFWVPAA